MSDYAARARRVAAIAALAAEAVDGEGRFPAEAVAAMKAERLLGCAAEGGDARATLGDLARICEVLGRSCASSAMVFAMHQVNIANLVTHGGDGWVRDYLGEVVADQLLVASSTSESGAGAGDIRTSVCAVTPMPDGLFALDKNAATISYGLEADAILATARRSPDAEASEQVMVLVRRSQRTLDVIQRWNVMGMRGTGGHAFRLEARGIAPGQVLPIPFATIAGESLLPVSHVLWGATWFGIAGAAIDKARACVRREARSRPGAVPRSAAQLAEAMALLDRLRSVVLTELARVEHAGEDFAALTTTASTLSLNALKINASELAVEAVQAALRVIGIAGYREDSPFSVARAMRDILSAPLMIGNDRIAANNGGLLLMLKADSALGGW